MGVYTDVSFSYMVVLKVPGEVLSTPTTPSPGLCDVAASIRCLGLPFFKTNLPLALISLQGTKYHSVPAEALWELLISP